MIVWGGAGTSALNDGARFNPTSGVWTALNASGAPGARKEHTAIWTGSEMIVWGGDNPAVLGDGGRYRPSTDSWTAASTTGAPAARRGHTAIWTGADMILWGGAGSSGNFNDTFSYTPTRILFLYQRQ
jgi:N-acetylneuraminic acid mutarotase